MTEADGARLSAMLAANPNLEPGTNSSSIFNRDANQASHSDRIENLEGVVGENATLDIGGKESPCVITTQAKGGLREVVRAE